MISLFSPHWVCGFLNSCGLIFYQFIPFFDTELNPFPKAVHGCQLKFSFLPPSDSLRFPPFHISEFLFLNFAFFMFHNPRSLWFCFCLPAYPLIFDLICPGVCRNLLPLRS